MGCQVCGLPDDGYHFKILSCRACTAFFRRSVVKQAKYQCKFSNDCPMTKELRKACAACRLSQCREVGMSEKDVQWFRDSNGPLKVPRTMEGIKIKKPMKSMSTEHSIYQTSSVSSSSVSVCSMESVPNTSSSCSSPLENQQQIMYLSYPKPQILPQIQAHVQQYFKGEKSLYTMLHPDRLQHDVIVFHSVTHTDLVQMDKGCLSLVQAMIFQINPETQQFSSDLKLTLLRSFFSLFSPLRKCYLTSMVFPTFSDNRFAFHYGQYFDRSNTDFFRDNSEPEKAMKLCDEIGFRSNMATNKLRTLQLREIEFAALTAIILANETDLLFANDGMSTFRDQIYQEIHDDIQYNYPAETANRFGSLLCMLQDLHNLSSEINESVMMCKLFSPHKAELWE